MHAQVELKQAVPGPVSVDSDDVAVTNAIVSFSHLIRAAHRVYLAESMMAEALGDQQPKSSRDRCRADFYGKHLATVKRIGLKPNEITFETLLRSDVPEEVNSTCYELLPSVWIFNPWRGWRKR